MGVIELSTLFILFLYVVIRGDKREQLVCVLAMIILFLVSALRHESVGSDIYGYVISYKRYSQFSFTEFINYINIYDVQDRGYYFSTWLFSRFFKNPQLWLAAVALFFSVSVGKLINNLSRITVLSVVMIISLGFFSFSMTGLRQIIALCILLFTYNYIKERRAGKFILTVLLASLFHKTALIFLIIYPVAYINLGKYHIIAAVLAFLIFYAFKDWLLIFMSENLQDGRFDNYLTGEANKLTLSGFIIQFSIFIFSLYYYKPYTKENKNALILYNMSFIGLVFQLFSSFIAEFFRVSMYFSIFNCILVPNALCSENDLKSHKVTQLVIIVVLLLYMFQGGKDYYMFFWENP
jgi:hypothetical protein